MGAAPVEAGAALDKPDNIESAVDEAAINEITADEVAPEETVSEETVAAPPQSTLVESVSEEEPTVAVQEEDASDVTVESEAGIRLLSLSKSGKRKSKSGVYPSSLTRVIKVGLASTVDSSAY